jgi:uncharacterized membrane protein YdjX (TVP38/TMEM64 family)
MTSDGGDGARAARLLTSPRVRLAGLAAVIVAATVAVYLLGGTLSPDEVTDALEGLGVLGGAIVFPVLYAVLTVLFVPGSILTAAAGVLFGTVLGAALSVAGATAGAIAAFLIARRLGRRDVERIARGRVGRLDRWLERRGFLAVLYLRLIPVVPFNALNYVAGATGVRLPEYALATAIGIVPGAFAYAALGSSLDDPGSPAFIAAVAAVLVLAVGAPLVERRLGFARRRAEAEGETDAGAGTGDTAG